MLIKLKAVDELDELAQVIKSGNEKNIAEALQKIHKHLSSR